MMTDVRLPLVLEALGSVDAELARIHYALRDLAAWPSAESPALPRAREAVRRGFACLRTIQDLLVHPPRDSYDERASSLRARSVVVVLQLTQLRGYERPDVVGTSFATVDAFADHVLQAIGRANAQWVRHGADVNALLRAERAFGEVGHDPRVASALQHGASSRDPHVRRTFAALVALFDLAAHTVPVPLTTRELADG